MATHRVRQHPRRLVGGGRTVVGEHTRNRASGSRARKGIEFEVGLKDRIDIRHHFKTWDKAAAMAVSLAASGSPAHIDVLIYSVQAARAWGGDDAVEQYKSDPDASVSERIVVNAESIGRVY